VVLRARVCVFHLYHWSKASAEAAVMSRGCHHCLCLCSAPTALQVTTTGEMIFIFYISDMAKHILVMPLCAINKRRDRKASPRLGVPLGRFTFILWALGLKFKGPLSHTDLLLESASVSSFLPSCAPLFLSVDFVCAARKKSERSKAASPNLADLGVC